MTRPAHSPVSPRAAATTARGPVAGTTGCVAAGLIAASHLLGASATAGPHPPAAGKPGSDAIAADDRRVRAWAVEATALVRGPEEIDDPFSLPASYGSEASALGRADVLGTQDQPEPGSPLQKPAVSLGDGGSITLRFDPPIADGPGPDFAVFENGISFNGGASFFMELAFVEASSDGTTFARFPALSETPATTQIGAYAAIDPTNVRNLAGKYIAGYGTPFDLAELAGIPGLNTRAVTHLRLVDVVGSIDPRHARHDSLGRVINDPWPTFLTTSGFDLDAVGVLHQAATGYAAWRASFDWTAAESDPEADPDADGVPNLHEFAFGLPPLHPQPAPSIELAATADGWVAMLPSVPAAARDLTVEAETSPDLRVWTAQPGPGPVRLGPVHGAPAYCRLRLRLVSPP
jgi:hypothetical protein